MSSGAVIAAIAWSLIVVALVAILGVEARRRRHQSHRRQERALRRAATSRTPQLGGAPERSNRGRTLDSTARNVGESETGDGHAA